MFNRGPSLCRVILLLVHLCMQQSLLVPVNVQRRIDHVLYCDKNDFFFEAQRKVSRREIAQVISIVSATAMESASASTRLEEFEEMTESNPALVWKSSSELSCDTSKEKTRRIFNSVFVSYLARFLLTYDRGSRLYWRAVADQIPLGWDEVKVKRKRAEQFAAFTNAVEQGLCPYATKSLEQDAPSQQIGVRQLLSLLRSRYGLLPDAARQLALLLSLIEPPFQPTDAIISLSGRAQNASVIAIDVIEPGTFAAFTKPIIQLSIRTPPAITSFNRTRKFAILAPAQVQPTGRLLDIILQDGGCGYDAKRPPRVTIAPPAALQIGNTAVARQAQAVALVDNKSGSIAGIVLLDGGLGYTESDSAAIEIEPSIDTSACGSVAAARAIKEWEVSAVSIVEPGSGYTSAQDLTIDAFVPPDEIENAASILRPPKLLTKIQSNQAMYDAIISARWAPRDAASASLTALLGSEYGVPAWNGERHIFPARAFGAIRLQQSSQLKRNVPLNLAQLTRLGLAGAVCTSATRATLNPLEVSKTRKQAFGSALNDTVSISRWTGVDATAASGAVLGGCSFAVYEFLQRAIPKLAVVIASDPAAAVQTESVAPFLASAGAVVFAAALVAPFEAAKVKLMLEPDTVSSLPAAFKAMALVSNDNLTEHDLQHEHAVEPIYEWSRLWQSFFPLVFRELPFTTAKLLTYSSAQTLLFTILPAARERPLAALAVSCFAGALAGAAGALLSSPADALVTELATGNYGGDWRKALGAILEGADSIPAVLPRFFRGASERMILFAIIITIQLLLFDFCRYLLHVQPDDLALSLDLFADRLSFYDYDASQFAGLPSASF